MAQRIFESELEEFRDPEDLPENSRLIPSIEFRDVKLAFDDQVILNGVSFAVHRGQTRIVLGPSGTGKSTIINLILGLIKPDDGQVLINGEDISEFEDQDLMRIRKTIGMWRSASLQPMSTRGKLFLRCTGISWDLRIYSLCELRRTFRRLKPTSSSSRFHMSATWSR